MPESLEKVLSKILCQTYLKSFNFEIPQYLLNKINEINFDQEFEKLNELINDYDIKINYSVVKKLKKYIKDQNWDSSIKLIKESIKHENPINFKELFRLIEKSKIATENLENKNIILLIGSTGCGKSTTVHFLAGSKMMKIKENDVEHIIPVIIEDGVLKMVKVSNLNKSETKYITAVKIPNEADIYVCDTPGLMDTAGAEVDIANTRGIVNAIKKCKSVRPLILLSDKAEGDRFQGFKTLACSLAMFCPGLKNHKQSFAYAFTKYKKNEIQNIYGRFKNSLNEAHDFLTRELIEDIVEKTRKEVNVISPLNDDPKELLQKILEIVPINDPEKVFNCFLTVESRNCIDSQIEIHKGQIELAIRSRDYCTIKDRLDNLKGFSNLFNEYKSKYEQCVNSVIEGTNEIFNNVTNLFNSSVHERNILIKDTVQKYKQTFNIIKQSETIREDHLKGETPISEALLLILNSNSNYMKKIILKTLMLKQLRLN